MNELFAAFEQTGPSVWMREAPYAYFIALIFHAWGMAFLVGGGIVISLRVLGVAKGAALQRFRAFFPVMGLGALLAIPSGVMLLIAYPAKALTNPVFAIKLVCLVTAALLVRRLARRVFATNAIDAGLPAGSRATAAWALALWLAVVATGKLLLYTYSVLMVT